MIVLEMLERAFGILLALVSAPLLFVSYIGGWVYGTAKHCFLVGYGTSIQGAAEKAKADQLELAINEGSRDAADPAGSSHRARSASEAEPALRCEASARGVRRQSNNL